MRKKPYRPVSVNEISIEPMRHAHAESEMVIGIDVAKTKFVASLMDRDSGEIVRTVRWTHPAETPLFIGLVVALPGAEVALESTGRYGDALVHRLRKSGVAIYRVSAKRVHDAAEEYDGVPSKHDGKDAAVIADLHRRGKSQPLRELTDSMRRLRACTTTMLRFKGQCLENLNRLEAELARFWPELADQIAINTQSALALLAAYGTPDAVAADPVGAAQTMHAASSGKLGREKLARILASAEATEGETPVEAETEMVRFLVQDTLRAQENWQKAEEKVHEAVRDDQSASRQAAVMGVTTAAIVMAKSGDAANFPNSRAWLKQLGLNLKVSSSGSGGQRGVHITKRGSPESRVYLHFAALRLIRFDRVVRSWYADHCKRPGAVKMSVVVKLTRKLAKALPHVARGAEFDSRKLFDLRLFPLLDGAALDGAEVTEGVEAA